MIISFIKHNFYHGGNKALLFLPKFINVCLSLM
jgi:hypothetical protein